MNNNNVNNNVDSLSNRGVSFCFAGFSGLIIFRCIPRSRRLIFDYIVSIQNEVEILRNFMQQDDKTTYSSTVLPKAKRILEHCKQLVRKVLLSVR